MHSNLRLDPAETKPVGAIQKAGAYPSDSSQSPTEQHGRTGQYSFDLSCPITAGEFLYPLLPTLADIPYQTHGSQPLRLLDLHWKQRSDYLRTLSSEPRSLYGTSVLPHIWTQSDVEQSSTRSPLRSFALRRVLLPEQRSHRNTIPPVWSSRVQSRYPRH